MEQRDTSEFGIQRVHADDFTPEIYEGCMDVIYEDVMANTRGATRDLALSVSWLNPYHGFDALRWSLDNPEKANMYIASRDANQVAAIDANQVAAMLRIGEEHDGDVLGRNKIQRGLSRVAQMLDPIDIAQVFAYGAKPVELGNDAETDLRLFAAMVGVALRDFPGVTRVSTYPDEQDAVLVERMKALNPDVRIGKKPVQINWRGGRYPRLHHRVEVSLDKISLGS